MEIIIILTMQKKINNFYKLLFLSLISLSTTSCSNPNVPEELTLYLDNMSFSSAIRTHLKGVLEFDITYYEYGEIEGYNIGTFTYDYYDSNNYYSLVDQTFFGYYSVNDIVSNIQSVTLVEDSEEVRYHYQDIDYLSDGSESVLTDDIVSADYIYSIFVESFFGEENQGLYVNGMYYGDTLDYMKDSYYMNMTINEDNTLTYLQEEYYISVDETYIGYSYTVDEYGMLLTYSNKMFTAEVDENNNPAITLIMNINIDYELTNID